MKTKRMKSTAYDNIPNARLRRLSVEYQRLKAQIFRLEDQAEAVWEEIIALGVGSYQNVTVYEVGEVKVRGYTRSGYKAIRTRAQNRA